MAHTLLTGQPVCPTSPREVPLEKGGTVLLLRNLFHPLEEEPAGNPGFVVEIQEDVTEDCKDEKHMMCTSIQTCIRESQRAPLL